MACPLNPLDCVTDVAKGAANDVLSSIASAFAKAADGAINWLWGQMSDATTIRLGGTAFNQLLGIAAAIAVVIAVLLFVIQLAVSAVRRDPGGVSRAVKGLFIMGIGGGLAVAVTEVLLQAVDALSAGVLQVTTGDTVAQMGKTILASGAISNSTSNPAGLILLSIVSIVAVTGVWLALTVRKILVIIAAILSPFAFAGAMADFSISWVWRWVEVVAALVISKLMLMFVFVIGLFVLVDGVGSAGSSGTQRITQTVSGVLVLALAMLTPLVAIKMFELAGVGHHLQTLHAAHETAAAGAAAASSMVQQARPWVLGGVSGGAAGAGMGASTAKAWSPNGSGTTAATDTPGEESPSGESPTVAPAAAYGSGPATTAPASNGDQSNGSTGPASTAGWANTAYPSPAAADGNGHVESPAAPSAWQSREAARNSTPGWDVPTGPAPAPPAPPSTDFPKGDPLP